MVCVLVSWIELTIDFAMSTWIIPEGKEAKKTNTTSMTAAIFSLATKKLQGDFVLPPWMSQPSRVGVLAAFGCRNMVGGFKKRPKLLNPYEVGRAMHKLKEEGDLTQVRINVTRSEFSPRNKWDLTFFLFDDYI